jgi:hypothetical protein
MDIAVAGAGGLLVPGLHRLDGRNLRALARPAQDLKVAAPLQVGGDEVRPQGAQADALALDQDERLWLGLWSCQGCYDTNSDCSVRSTTAG